MANYKTAFGSYLKAEDLQGKAVRITIERVEMEEIKSNDGTKEKKLVAHFVGKDKGLVLNRTNADSLCDIFADEDTDNWGGTVVLYPDTTTFGGKKVACIRIRGTVPVKPVEPEPMVEGEDDPIPF